jgi:hypothetical protein
MFGQLINFFPSKDGNIRGNRSLITLMASYYFMRDVELLNKKVLFGALGVVFGAVLVAAF